LTKRFARASSDDFVIIFGRVGTWVYRRHAHESRNLDDDDL
jgi:hypothetical protein